MFESRNNLLPVNFFQFRLKVFSQTISIFCVKRLQPKKIVSAALGLFAFFNAILQEVTSKQYSLQLIIKVIRNNCKILKPIFSLQKYPLKRKNIFQC
jgi:hypothetical protein